MAEPSAEDIAGLTAVVESLHDCVHKQTSAAIEATAELAKQVGKNRASSERNHAAMASRMLRQEKALAELARTVGSTNDPPGDATIVSRLKRAEATVGQPDDEPGDSTIVSRLKRAEGKIRNADIIRDRIKTGVAVASPIIVFFIGVLWWLERARIEKLLGLP